MSIEAQRLIDSRQAPLAGGKMRLVLNRPLPARSVPLPFGDAPIKAPMARDRKGGEDAPSFGSRVLPRRLRRSKGPDGLIP